MLAEILKIIFVILFPFIAYLIPGFELPEKLKPYAYVAWVIAVFVTAYNFWLTDHANRTLADNIQCTIHRGVSCPPKLTLPYWLPDILGIPSPPPDGIDPHITEGQEQLNAAKRYAEQLIKKASYDLLNENYSAALTSLNDALTLCSYCVEAYRFRGDAYRGLHRYDEARADYKRALGENPKDFDAREGLGMSWLGKMEPGRAIPEFDQAISLAPTSKNYENRADAYFLEGSYDAAISDYNSALALDSDSDELSRKLANALSSRGVKKLANGQTAEAINDLTNAISKAPSYPNAYERLADAYMQFGDTTSALENYKKALSFNPDLTSALVGECSVYVAAYDWKNATAQSLAATKISPRDASAFYCLGRAYNGAGDYSSSKQALDAAIGINPNFADAYKERGNASFGLNRYDDALADYQAALNLRPNYPEALNNRGFIFAMRGKIDEALSDYTVALRKKPKFPTALHNRAILYYGVGAFGKAIRDFNALISIVPRTSQYFKERGNAFASSQVYNAAIKDYDAALELEPKNADIFKNRANAKRDSGDTGGSLADYQSALSIDPQFAEAYENRGVAFCQLNNLDAAINDLNKAISLKSGYAAAYNARGNIYLAQQKWDLAKSDFGAVSRIDPNFKSAQSCSRPNSAQQGNAKAGEQFFDWLFGDTKKTNPPANTQPPASTNGPSSQSEYPAQQRSSPPAYPYAPAPSAGTNQYYPNSSYYSRSGEPTTSPDTAPKRIGKAGCAYPSDAQSANLEGEVTLSITVSVYGSVEGVKIFRSSGSEKLDDAAVKCVRSNWHFTSATKNGVATEATYTTRIKFLLGDSQDQSSKDDDN